MYAEFMQACAKAAERLGLTNWKPANLFQLSPEVGTKWEGTWPSIRRRS